MRCKEAKARMIKKNGKLDKELLNHIQSCPECANSAEAVRLMKKFFDDAKKPEQIVSFNEIREAVNAQAAKFGFKEKIMSFIKYQYNQRPRMLTGISLAVIAFLFVVLVPLSYERVVGYEVIISDVAKENLLPVENLESMISAIGYENARIILTAENEYTVTGITESSQAHNIAVTLAALTKSTGDPITKTIRKIVSGTLYAQVAEKIKDHIDKSLKLGLNEDGEITLNGESVSSLLKSTELSDEQIYGKIVELFERQGISKEDVSISVDKSDQGNYRELTLYPDKNKAQIRAMKIYANDREISLWLDDSNRAIITKYEDMFEIVLPLKGDTLRAPALEIKMDLDKQEN